MTNAATPPDSPPLRAVAARKVAEVAFLFCVAVIGAMFVYNLAEGRHRWLESQDLAELQTQLRNIPADEALKEEIRKLDTDLRRTFTVNRRRNTIAAWLLAVGAAVAVVGRAIARANAPFPVPVLPPTHEQIQARARIERRRAARTSSVLVAAVAIAAVVLGIWSSRHVPGSPQDGGGQPVQSPPAPSAEEWAANWGQFRGPTAMGLAPDREWPTTWDGPKGVGVAWKTPLPGKGNGSPVAWGDRLYLTTAETFDAQMIHCYSRTDGALLWSTKVAADRATPAAFAEIEIMEETGYAASTPVTDGRFVVATFASADIVCLDVDGNIMWQHSMGVPDSAYGLATSLILDGENVIWQLDQGNDPEAPKSALYAIDIVTGKTKWRTPRSLSSSWSTPIVVTTSGRRELITCGSPLVISYDPATGKEYWRADILSGDVAPMPVCYGDVAYVTNAGAQAAGIRTGGSGDVTKTHVLWTGWDGLPDTASPLVDAERFYQVGSDGYLVVLSTKSGKMLYEQEFKGAFEASPVLAGGLIYTFSSKGVTTLFEPGDTYVAKHQNPLGEAIRATPAFIDGDIIVRGSKHLLCIRAAK